MLGRLKKELAAKLAKLHEMTDAPALESRDMTPDETAAMDTLLDEVSQLKDRVAKLEQIEAGEAGEAEANRSAGRRSAPMNRGFAIHADEKKPYSYLRAIKRAGELGGRVPDGLEGEISQEIAKRCNKTPEGFYLPLGSDPEIRALMNPGRVERRDLTTTTGAGAIFNVPEGDLIDLLRGKLVIRDLGAKIMTGMHGVFSIPRQNSANSFQWLAEGVSANTTNQTYDQVPFTPHVGIAGAGLTRMLLNQTSLDAEALVKEDLSEVVARGVDSAAIYGPGGVAPLGILNRTGIQSRSAGLFAPGGNGGFMTYNRLVAMESLITSANADQGKLAYLTTSNMRGALKSTAKILTGTTQVTSEGIWENVSGQAGVGELNGYPAFTSTLVPSNLSHGTSGNVLSAVILGYWPDLVVSLWDHVDTVVNPFSPQMSAGVVISMTVSADVQTRHDEGFAIVVDGQTS